MTATAPTLGQTATCTCGEHLIVTNGLGQRDHSWDHADMLTACPTPTPAPTADPLAIGTEISTTSPGRRRAQRFIITGHGDPAQGQGGMIFGRLPNRQFPGDFRSGERFLGERADLLAERNA